MSHELERLREENARLERDQAEQKKRAEDLDARLSKVLGELAEYRRDRSRTYAADAPRAHVITDEWRHFRDQDFRSVVRDLRKLSFSGDDTATWNRREISARMREVLAREVLMREYAVKRRGALRAAVQEIVDHAAHLPLEEGERLALAAGLETSLGLGDGVPPPVAAEDLWRELGCDEGALDETIRAKLETFIHKARELVSRVMSTDPPGRLWMEEDGAPFDSERHDADLGCDEEGLVRWTAFPGYQIGDRVICKSTVHTKPAAPAIPQDALVDEAPASPTPEPSGVIERTMGSPEFDLP